MQDNFFKLRDTSNRLPDLGYIDQAFASGDAEKITAVKAEIEAKSADLTALTTSVNTMTAERNRVQTKLNENKVWQYKENGLCKKTDSNNKCKNKRSVWEASSIKSLIAIIANINVKIATSNSKITTTKASLSALELELATLLQSQVLESQSIATLAQQGLTPDAVKLRAEADASAIVAKAKADADIKDRKSKSKKVIIITLVVVAVILAGIWAFKKLRKK